MRSVCGSACGHIKVLRQIDGRRGQALTQVVFFSVSSDGEALHRTDVDAGVALDTFRRDEHGLHVAVETALYFARGLLGVKAHLDFDVELLEPLDQDSTWRIFCRGDGL